MFSALHDFDMAVLTFLTSFVGRSPLFDHLNNALSRFDAFKGIALMCLFWYTWANAPANEPDSDRQRRQRRMITVLIGTVLIGGLSRTMQVSLPIHQRPLLSNLGLPFPETLFDGHSLSNWNSFPSDHAMFFFALGTGLWSINRTAGWIAFIWTIVIIDFPRVYLGIHYPSDVIFGALFGFLGMKALLALPLGRFERTLDLWRGAHQGLAMAFLFLLTIEVGDLMAELRELAHSSAGILIH